MAELWRLVKAVTMSYHCLVLLLLGLFGDCSKAGTAHDPENGIATCAKSVDMTYTAFSWGLARESEQGYVQAEAQILGYIAVLRFSYGAEDRRGATRQCGRVPGRPGKKGRGRGARLSRDVARSRARGRCVRSRPFTGGRGRRRV